MCAYGSMRAKGKVLVLYDSGIMGGEIIDGRTPPRCTGYLRKLGIPSNKTAVNKIAVACADVWRG